MKQIAIIVSDFKLTHYQKSQEVGGEPHWLAKSQDQGFVAFSQGNASRAAVAIKITAGSCRICGWL
jgi:hypothetical protein